MVMPAPLLTLGAVIAAQPLPSMVTVLVIVTGPYLPGSSAAMIPPAATAAYAAANEAHGAAIVHGLVSTPVEETKVRVRLPAACAGSTNANADISSAIGGTARVMISARL
jgi:hypothetical protein